MRYEQTVYNHMSTNQLADYWGISARTLERWRGIGYGPHFVKVGGRVLYRVEDILEYMLHRQDAGPNGFECGTSDMLRYDTGYAVREEEANFFAACLLMPAHDFRHQVEGEPFSFDLLGHCADRYGVSLTSAVLRWLEFTSKRAVAVFSEDGYMHWAKSSPKAFKSGKYFATRSGPIPVPSTSLAAKQIFSFTARDGVRHAPGAWFDEEAVEYTIYSEEYEKTLTVILLDNTGGYDLLDEEHEMDASDMFRRWENIS
jgi:hypothetical protein